MMAAGSGRPLPERTTVAVVGGGLTGLALGHHLRRAHVAHVVLEAEGRPGGVIRSARVDRHLLEWGPQRTRLTAGLRELLVELDLADELITAPADLPLYVYSRGRLRRVPLTAFGFLTADILPLRSKLRLLLEPLTAAAEPNETVARFFTRKLGRGFYEAIAGPLYGGLYASDPADMIVRLSLGHVLQEFGVGRSLVLRFLRRGASIHPPAACSFRDGMEVLVRALYGRNAENVWLSQEVASVEPHPPGGWKIMAGSSVLLADQVVFTSPAGATARILEGSEPGIAARLKRLKYNPLAIVHLHAATPLRGLGYQVSLGERRVTRGVTFNDSLFARTGVYTAYLGGAKAPGVIDWSDDAIGAAAVREFAEITGFDAEVLSVAREWMPAWDASWAGLDGMTPPVGVRFAANWESRPGIPGRLAQAKRLAGELA